MLPRTNRIKEKKDFETIFRKSKSFRSHLFTLKIIKNNLRINRFGFVVSQKISKKATVRNKIRRRFAQAVKGQIAKIKNGTDVVIIALPGVEKKDFTEIKETINDAFIKARLIPN